MSQYESLAGKEITVAQFLKVIKRERVSGREFLALIGHSDISNEDYMEIKETPTLTYERLVEILVNSPLTSEDYENMLETMRDRRIRRERELNKKKPPAPVDEEFSEEPRESLHETEEITLGNAAEEEDDYGDYAGYEEPEEDLWDEGSKYSDFAPEDKSEYFDEYGENEDYEENASRENRPQRIACLVIGLAVAFLSFFIRYTDTGAWGLPDGSFKPPATYEEIFALLANRIHLQDARFQETPEPPRIYRAEKFAEKAPALSRTVNNSVNIFRADGDNIKAFGIAHGKIADAPDYKSEKKLLGVFFAGGKSKLYAVYEDEYQVSEEYNTVENDEIVANKLEFTQACTVVLTFDALEWTGVPIAEYRQDGSFADIIVNGDHVFVITDYFAANSITADIYGGYVPSRAFGESRDYAEVENIAVFENSHYSDMTVIGGLTPESGFFAVTGGWAQIYEGDNTLLFAVRDGRNSELIRYTVYENSLVSPVSVSVDGEVINADSRGGLSRVAAYADENGGSVNLYTFDNAMEKLSTVEKIAAGEIPKGAAFDDRNVYIIADNLYAIDTSAPDMPIPTVAVDAMITDREFYAWGESNFVSVSMEANEYGDRQGVRVTVYAYSANKPPVEKASVLLTPPNPKWSESMSSPIESGDYNAVAVSYESGIIVVPLIYFDGLTHVERYAVLGYDDMNGFTPRGFVEDFVDAYSKKYAAIVADGYIYCFFGDMIKSAATDTTIVDVYTTNSE